MITRPLHLLYSPNPSSGAFLIQANTAIPVEVLRTDVFNSTGQRISVEVHSIANGVSLDLSDYPDGIYYCDVIPRLAGRPPSFRNSRK